MGYKLAGCDVIGDLEIDKKMNEVYVKNHNPKYNYLMDIREFNKLENLPEELYNLDILDGSPPCTTFSMAGDREESWGKKKKFREGQAEQTLDDLSFVFIQTVNKLKPKAVIMENVEGLLLGEAWSYVQRIYSEFKGIGYRVNHYLCKAEKMGVPFYVDIGTSIVAIRCTADDEVLIRRDHGWNGKFLIDEMIRVCAKMNEVAKHPIGNAASLIKALKAIDEVIWDKKRHTREEVEAHRLATEAITNYNAEEGHQ